jgi:virulence factor Mce-like protein
MRARAIIGALAALCVAGVLVAASGGDAPYEVRVELATANGLREGSDVKTGGVRRGKILKLELAPGDKVFANLELDDDTSIGRGASARVVTSNLLGSKYIELRPGDTKRRQPSGAVIAANRVTYPVDLDQVVNVLDGDTRARLQVLINEAGAGLTGRRSDWNQTLRVLGPTLADADRLVAVLARDNSSLATTVAAGSRFVERLSGERRQLGRLVDVAGATMRTTAQRRTALRLTLQEAPGTLVAARGFLSDLRRTTTPLRPAATALRATAPALSSTLAELPGFQRAAEPTLAQASRTAPALTRLGRRATPVLRRAVPTLRTTADVLGTTQPVTKALRVSIDDVLGMLEGWGRAIQTRDRLGHVFRGRAAVGVETFRVAISKLANAMAPVSKRSRTAKPSRPRPPATNAVPDRRPKPTLPDALKTRPRLPTLDELKQVTDPLDEQIDKALGDLLGGRRPRSGESAGNPLLDFLLKP